MVSNGFASCMLAHNAKTPDDSALKRSSSVSLNLKMRLHEIMQRANRNPSSQGETMTRPVSPRVCTIPNSQLSDIEELALATLHMSKDDAMERFSEDYEDTYAKCLETFECKGMYASFPIEGRDGDEIHLEDGAVLKSQVLADLLHRADEVVFYAVCAHGYEEVSAAAADEDDLIASMFYDAWGGGYTIAAHRWIKRAIADAARENGRYAGRGWAPGEEGLEMQLQKTLLEQLDLSQIGMSITGQYTVRPIMSLCGIMGVSNDEGIMRDGADRTEYH